LVEDYLVKKFEKFTPVRFSKQVVNGIIYRIKFEVDNSTQIYAKIITPTSNDDIENLPFLMAAQEYSTE